MTKIKLRSSIFNKIIIMYLFIGCFNRHPMVIQGVQRGWKGWKSWKKGGFSKKAGNAGKNMQIQQLSLEKLENFFYLECFYCKIFCSVFIFL